MALEGIQGVGWGENRVNDDKRAAKRILVVEDDRDSAESLAIALSDEGYEVTLALGGVEALAAARNVHPELVLLDVRLPDRDGFLVARDLALDPGTTSVPILFVSGTDDLPKRIRGCSLREVDFLRKPYRLDELLTRVDRCLIQAESSKQLRREANIDALTGLGNLRSLEERMTVEAARIERYRTPLTVGMIDVDRLKAVNDHHGHQAGSAVLDAIGQAMKAEIRETDFAARFGGDEFVVLLPHSDVASGAAFAERLLARVRGIRPGGLSVSVSIGIASFDQRIDRSVKQLLQRADSALYQAKHVGGDRALVDRGPAVSNRNAPRIEIRRPEDSAPRRARVLRRSPWSGSSRLPRPQ